MDHPTHNRDDARHQPPIRPIEQHIYTNPNTPSTTYMYHNDIATPLPHPHPHLHPPPRPRPKYVYKIHYHVSCAKTGARYHIIRRGPSYLVTLEKAKLEVEQFHASWFEYWWNACLEWAAMDQFKRRSRRWWARNARRYKFADRESPLVWREWERICLGKHGGMGEEWLRGEARRGRYWERGTGEEWGFPEAPEAAVEDVRGDRLRQRGVRRVWSVRRVGWGNLARVRVVRVVRVVRMVRIVR